MNRRPETAIIIMQAKPQGSSDEFPISLQIDGQLPEIFIDPGAITNIMNNLIDNAIQFTPEHGSVTRYIDCIDS